MSHVVILSDKVRHLSDNIKGPKTVMAKRQKRRRYRRSNIAPDTTNLNFRLPIDEKHILDDFADEICRRHRQWNRSDVWKELMGITDSGIIPPELRRELYERLEQLRKGREMPPNDKGYIHDSHHVIPFTKEAEGPIEDEAEEIIRIAGRR